MQTKHLLVLALGLAFGAAAADVPKLKPGLWELTTTLSGTMDKPPSMRSCIDDATQKEMMDLGQGAQRQMCSRHSVRSEGGRIVSESECKIGATRMTSRGATTFSGDSGYRTEVRAVYDPPLAGQKETTVVVEARHIGACPPGMKAGDVDIAGRRMNLHDMRGAVSKGASK